MSTLRRLPKHGPYGPQKQKLAHMVRRAVRSNRYCPESPISTLRLRKTLCLPHSGVKPGAPLLSLGANALVGTAANFPFVKRRQIAGRAMAPE
jgi:hypothetical protein